MVRYICKRLLAVLLVLFIVMTLGFFLTRLMPGGILDGVEENLSAEMTDLIYAKYNLDKPIVEQYVLFLKGVVTRWDWGVSLKMFLNVDVWSIMASRIPISLYLGFMALLISVPLGIGFGILAALKKNGIVDHFISFWVVFFISVPSFVLATLLQYTFAFKLKLFPVLYDGTASSFTSTLLPVLALSFSPTATITRYLRAELNETLNSDFMLLARTKGLTRVQATVRHGLRNSLLPVINIIIPAFVSIMSGSLVVESIFGIPGLGGITVKSINAADYSVTLAALVYYTLISLLAILLVDVLHGIVDPRIRMGGRKSE